MSATTQTMMQRLSALLPAGTNGEPRARAILRSILPPFLGIGVFLILWHVGAAGVETSLGKLPGPIDVVEQAGSLYQEYRDERAREADFYREQETRKAEFLVQNPGQEFQPSSTPASRPTSTRS